MVEAALSADATHEQFDALVRDAATMLLGVFDHMATAEALTRALVCERTERPAKSDFWVAVYRHLRETPTSQKLDG